MKNGLFVELVGNVMYELITVIHVAMNRTSLRYCAEPVIFEPIPPDVWANLRVPPEFRRQFRQ